MNQNNDNGSLPRLGMPYSDADNAYVDTLVATATRRAIAGAPARQAARRRALRHRWLTAAAAAVVALVAALAITLTSRVESTATGALLAQAAAADSARDEFGFATIDYTAADSDVAAEATTDPGPIDDFINTLDASDAASLAACEAELDVYDYNNYI